MKTITPGELSKRWSISEGALSDQRRTGKGPAWRRAGHRVEYLMKDVFAHEGRQHMREEDVFLAIDDLAKMVGVAKATIRRWVKAGTFPAPAQLSTKAHRWSRAQVLSWLSERPMG